jgi:hypothetical protein
LLQIPETLHFIDSSDSETSRVPSEKRTSALSPSAGEGKLVPHGEGLLAMSRRPFVRLVRARAVFWAMGESELAILPIPVKPPKPAETRNRQERRSDLRLKKCADNLPSGRYN